MKEKILQELKTRAAKSGCSERTIETYVNNILLPEDESGLTDDFYASHVNILNTLGGQMSADIARQVDEFKKNYKAPQPPTLPTPPTPPATVLPPEFAEFQKEVREFMEARKANEERANREGILAQVRKNLTELGATDDFVLDFVFMSKADSIDYAASIDDITKSMREEYDTQFSRSRQTTGAPNFSGDFGGNATLSAEQKAEVVKRNHEKYCGKVSC